MHPTAEQAEAAVREHLDLTTDGEVELKGRLLEIAPGRFRGLVAATPSGPLLLMEWGLSAREAG